MKHWTIAIALSAAACTPSELPVTNAPPPAAETTPIASALPPASAPSVTKPALANVTVLPSGLEIEVLRQGSGDVATNGSTCVMHYVGTLVDGKEFDSSRKRGTPFEFRLGAGMVIQGWEEGIRGMREGELRRLKIPPDLAYGKRGHPPVIPPESTLVFEVELLEVK